jgi:hypothetical protein
MKVAVSGFRDKIVKTLLLASFFYLAMLSLARV